jgi:glycosyltransferase involved in cell wall biosynthesis
VDVSICVPVRNEKLALRKTIQELIEAFEKLPYEYEIIIVDDGSTDGCVDEIRDLGVRVIRHKRNLGGGVARVTGMRHAKAPLIFQTDADGTYPCDKIPEIMERMKSADMVVAARNRESATDWQILRIFMKWLLKFLAGILAGHNIPDLNSGMRAYNSRLALRYAYLYPKGHSIMSTMTLAFLTENLRVEFVDIDYRKRIGKSTFRPIQDTYNYLITIIRTIVYFDPLRLLMPVSLFILAVAVFFTLRDVMLFLRINSVTVISWITALLVIILAILSDQFSRLSRQIAHLASDNMEDDYMIEETTPCPKDS